MSLKRLYIADPNDQRRIADPGPLHHVPSPPTVSCSSNTHLAHLDNIFDYSSDTEVVTFCAIIIVIYLIIQSIIDILIRVSRSITPFYLKELCCVPKCAETSSLRDFPCE
jgi:hypothetical protein